MDGASFAILKFRLPIIFCIISSMRKLNVAVRQDIDPILQGLYEQSLETKISDEEESRSIDQVRTGNIYAVESLILSCQHLTFKLMIQYQVDPPYDDTVDFVNVALRNLVKMEVGGFSKSVFSRFTAWTIRQALLKKTGNIE
jgi:hypothetical protein